MKEIGITCYLYRPYKRYSGNEYYTHYSYINKESQYEQNLMIIRTSDKCYKVIAWRVSFNLYPRPTIEMKTFRSWEQVRYYSKKLIEGGD